MNESLRRLGDVSRFYEQKADSAEKVYVDAAEADATYKHERAKAVLRHKGSGGPMSQGEAETRADADDQIYQFHRDKVVLSAKAEALKAKLVQLKEQNANGRTATVDERKVDEFHAQGGTP